MPSGTLHPDNQQGLNFHLQDLGLPTGGEVPARTIRPRGLKVPGSDTLPAAGPTPTRPHQPPASRDLDTGLGKAQPKAAPGHRAGLPRGGGAAAIAPRTRSPLRAARAPNGRPAAGAAPSPQRPAGGEGTRRRGGVSPAERASEAEERALPAPPGRWGRARPLGSPGRSRRAAVTGAAVSPSGDSLTRARRKVKAFQLKSRVSGLR